MTKEEFEEKNKRRMELLGWYDDRPPCGLFVYEHEELSILAKECEEYIQEINALSLGRLEHIESKIDQMMTILGVIDGKLH